MKILIIQDHLRSGGTERQSVLLANAFTSAGHPTVLLTFRPDGSLAPTVHPDVEREVLQPFDTCLDWFAPGLTRAARAIDPHIILCMGRMANCYAGRLQQHLPGSAVVSTYRTGKPLPPRFQRSLHLVRHIVANSHEARTNLVAAHSLSPERVSVIHNALVFPAQAGAEIRDSLRAQYGASPSTTVLLCVAMFRPEKNQRELIEIVAGLPASIDWQLWLAGDGPARATCVTLAAQRGLDARVKFTGWQANPAPLYAAADIAVHASWSEALSNFLIEAQAQGKPGIAYAAQGIAECFLPGKTGFVIPRDDRAAFREQVLALAAEPPAARTARATEARSYASQTFDREHQVARYLELFSRLAPRSS